MTAVAAQLNEDEAVLLNFIRSKALKTDGPFKLFSGKESPYFLDMKQVLNDGLMLPRVARLVLANLPRETTAVGGLAMGSIPISTAVLIERARTNPEVPLHGFWVRREEKTHGLGGRISGTLVAGDRAVIVDDVTTEGNSVLMAVDAVKKAGANVLKVISIVDRDEGASRTLAARGIPFKPIFTSLQVRAW